MKYFFVVCLSILMAASFATYEMMPESKSDIPIIYWVTDANPARKLQIKTCRAWQKTYGHPEFEVRVDTANMDRSKIVIQGVSGVAGDVLDHAGSGNMRFYNAIGLLEDVTEEAKRLKFDPSQTFKAILPEITIDGRQYVFPSNVAVNMLWVNRATFKKYGVEIPSRRWTFDDFERIGKQFIKAANEGKKHRDSFLLAGPVMGIWRRSIGLDTYNETLTACILDDPRHVKLLRRVYKWMNEDHIIATDADRQSFSTEAGYGGSTFQLFNSGNYGLVTSGRYALIQFRKFGTMDLAVVELPHGGFPNTVITTRAGGVYRAGKHKKEATLFLAYLASEEYNMNIVMDADALPPNPKYTKLEAYLRPKDYPNEWGCHEVFSETAENIAIVYSSSPFVLQAVAGRNLNDAENGFWSDIYTAEGACKMMQERINTEIKRSLQEDPKLQPRYDKQIALQKKIEEYRKNGKKVPLEWISNPFYREYYMKQGWAEIAPAASADKEN